MRSSNGRISFDGRGWKNAVAELYRVEIIPQTYLIDKNLKIVAEGLRGDELEERLRVLLGPGDVQAVEAAETATEWSPIPSRHLESKTLPDSVRCTAARGFGSVCRRERTWPSPPISPSP